MASPLRKLRLPRTDGKPAFPRFEPLHPAFVGRSKVLTVPSHREKNADGSHYVVDLGAGTCTCQWGEPFRWDFDKSKWITNQYCSHKIRAMADVLDRKITESAGEAGLHFPVEMQQAYAKAVGSRYNNFEVVSAFHKELRRGSIEHAVFWGHMLANSRGVPGVLRYMLNIVYEETRDHWLANWLLNANEHVKRPDGSSLYVTMLYGIALFCKAPKKWELPHRTDFLFSEMRGYAKLIRDYGRDVAKAGNIISVDERDKLIAALRSGLQKRDLLQVQYGLKGLQKLVVADIDAHRAWIINVLWGDSNLLNATQHHGTEWPSNQAHLHEFISRRVNAKFGIGYHELNMFIDHWCGEIYSTFDDMPTYAKAIIPELPPRLKLGVAPNIPIYAQDNHTYAGKALLRRFPEEWQPGATQKNIDLRLCGAYMGVIWRHLAYKQHGRIDCEWGDVKWPKWLSDTAANLWY